MLELLYCLSIDKTDFSSCRDIDRRGRREIEKVCNKTQLTNQQ